MFATFHSLNEQKLSRLSRPHSTKATNVPKAPGDAKQSGTFLGKTRLQRQEQASQPFNYSLSKFADLRPMIGNDTMVVRLGMEYHVGDDYDE